MTTTSSTPSAVRGGLFRRIGRRLRTAARKVTSTVRRSVGRLRQRVTEPDSAIEGAVVEGVEATVEGKNPVWGAVKGAWHGLSVPWRVAIVVIAVLVLLLAPVLAILLLLALLIFAIVRAVRSRSTSPATA
ncbi:hypothetical protein ATJ97_0524 [Georgenia soli]|uniref:Uncharacterized protein n=1 Tax=Georgenia soli TaxID=638953 RepID=A0A2A9EGK3_9MICO|nr:hypothetical protein [Georgenia soli]PFG38054.1 hypothetical protein ATJ97_0524 [Georgenia soli]